MTASMRKAGQARGAGWKDRVLLGFFLVSAVTVFGLWATYFSDGTASGELFEPFEERGILLGRTSGALMAGFVLSIAAAGLQTGRRWARGLVSFGVGMVGYGALNTLGETLASRSVESVVLLLALLLAVVVLRTPTDHPRAARLCMVLAGCAVWLVGRTMQVGGGSLAHVVSVSAWPGPHYLAEAVMALVTVWGLLARRRGRAWGIWAALVGLGMYCYSTLNALDWAYVNDKTVVPMLAVTLGAAIAGAVDVMIREESHHANRHRSSNPGHTPDGSRRHPVRQQG